MYDIYKTSENYDSNRGNLTILKDKMIKSDKKYDRIKIYKVLIFNYV